MSGTGTKQSLELKQLDSDSFVNAWPPWLPDGAQGIYGGTLIAQCLVAAQRTIPADFMANSMHCSFLVGGNPDSPMVYHVERLPQQDDVEVRAVRAHQDDKCIFVASLSFKNKEHEIEEPCAEQSPQGPVFSPPDGEDESDITGGGLSEGCPFLCSKVEILRSNDGRPERAKTWQRIKTRDAIDEDQGSVVHTAALAYMSDNYFLPTTTRIHNILWTREPELHKKGQIAVEAKNPVGVVKLIVTLDHSIYFHNPAAFRADEWMLAEMEAPWAGDGRTLVLQRIFKQDGTLIATALQEGVLRLQPPESKL